MGRQRMQSLNMYVRHRAAGDQPLVNVFPHRGLSEPLPHFCVSSIGLAEELLENKSSARGPTSYVLRGRPALMQRQWQCSL